MVLFSSPKKTTRLAATSAAWLLLSSPAHAYFPFVTDDTGTQGAGGNQIEIDYAFNKSTNAIADVNGNFIEDELGISNAYPLPTPEASARTLMFL